MRLRVWTVGLVLFLVSVQGCLTLNPATGREEFLVFTTPLEVMIGQGINAQMGMGARTSVNKESADRLERIGHRVAQVSDRQDYEYHFYLVNDDSLNAFTTPGGNIYFNTGLFNKLNSDDEIAAVLAHEVGHCSARHVAKKFQAAFGYDLLSGMVMGGIQNDVRRRIARMSADALVSLGLAAFSRTDENEADRLGVKYTYLAGYDPNGLAEAFAVLAAESGDGKDEGWIMLRTHPRLADRIAAVKKEIELVKARY
ncbi:MAG: M48 family metalloprotease [Candidatus Omnitrophica bacterium]|nr:M48 family metalloprotease [Candidatus Omnitrophota bacterium]